MKAIIFILRCIREQFRLFYGNPAMKKSDDNELYSCEQCHTWLLDSNVKFSKQIKSEYCSKCGIILSDDDVNAICDDVCVICRMNEEIIKELSPSKDKK